MPTSDFADIKLPYDPIIDVIFHDARRHKVFKRSIQAMTHIIVPYGNTLHPSDQLLDAWYRFKENQLCQR